MVPPGLGPERPPPLKYQRPVLPVDSSARVVPSARFWRTLPAERASKRLTGCFVLYMASYILIFGNFLVPSRPTDFQLEILIGKQFHYVYFYYRLPAAYTGILKFLRFESQELNDSMPQDQSNLRLLLIGSPDHSPIKRLCRQRRSCTKQGGRCIQRDETCSTISSDDLCKGASCKCCLGNNPSCAITPSCHLQGGFCFKKSGKDSCADGTVIKNGCLGKRCACCIPKKVKCRCGVSNGDRIIGGTEVSPPFRYPWLVGIYETLNLERPFCGGSIINTRYVVTAAHCMFTRENEPIPASKIRVKVAEHDVASEDDDVEGVTRMLALESYVVHEDYKRTSTWTSPSCVLRKREGQLFWRLGRPSDGGRRREVHLGGDRLFRRWCAKRKVPGVYTRITELLEWISSKTAEVSYCQ
nr:uncharacterized protein LOC113800310 [Penaeus vannamei]